ncbi:5'-3'_deoxyribonucleotidase [Hexamita inflata]|uniref:Putative n=1 Tax=Hexamita inflata TaxID=28002 RepID=A0AA86QEH1_9EUKA|nr:5'-3' deoxyribonucleotidase [Hexamita inflata]
MTTQVPTNKSILFDLDGTIFSMSSTLLPRINKYYDRPVIEAVPMIEHMQQTGGIYPGLLTVNSCYQPRLFVEQQIYPQCFELINYLIDNQFDVWFVTMPLQNYHTKSSQQEKIAQIQRYFGQKLAQHVIFSSKKYKIPGLYLVDDRPQHPAEESKAQWKAILMEQVYNHQIDCSRRISTNNALTDMIQLLNKDAQMRIIDEKQNNEHIILRRQ